MFLVSYFRVLRSTDIFFFLNSSTESFISVWNVALEFMNVIGNELIAVVATVEISMTAPTRNRLAWIRIPTMRVFLMSLPASMLSLPKTPLMMDQRMMATSAKFAKFFMMFRIFRR